MHDFLDDLRHRLDEARAELHELNEYIRSLESLIPLEQKRQQRAKAELPDLFRQTTPARPKRRRLRAGQPSPIKEFLITTMGSAGRMWSLDDLKRAAAERQVNFDGKSPGHVLHFALVALKHSGQARYDDERKQWWLTGEAAPLTRRRLGEAIDRQQ
jgi:hypothetical protein